MIPKSHNHLFIYNLGAKLQKKINFQLSIFNYQLFFCIFARKITNKVKL